MVEDVVEPLDMIFGDIKNGALLVLEHPHAADAVGDVLGEELSEDSPDIGNRHEALVELYLDGNEVLLAREQTPG